MNISVKQKNFPIYNANLSTSSIVYLILIVMRFHKSNLGFMLTKKSTFHQLPLNIVFKIFYSIPEIPVKKELKQYFILKI